MSTHETQMLVTSFPLQQIKEVGVVTRQQDITSECTCKPQWYIIFMLSLLTLGIVFFVILQS